MVIQAILQTPLFVKVEHVHAGHDLSKTFQSILDNLPVADIGAAGIGILFAFFIYSAILVGLVGQTLGMTVMDLRVVRTDYGRPTIVQSVWRYIVGFFSMLTFFATFGFFVRVHPHDRLSRTRLVRARRAT
jgi:uncharacterized RDD family membrane protein YckC